MPRKSYAAHRAARLQQGHDGYGHGSVLGVGSYAESETDAESLASYSTLLSTATYATYDSSYSTEYAYGYPRPQIRSRTFSASSGGSLSPNGRGESIATVRGQGGPGYSNESHLLPILAHPRPRYLHPLGGRVASSGSKVHEGGRLGSFSPSDGIPELADDHVYTHDHDHDHRHRLHESAASASHTYPSDPSLPPRIHVQASSPTKPMTNPRPPVGSFPSPAGASPVVGPLPDADHHRADRARRREAREARRAARRQWREAKSTLKGEKYDTVLRKMMRWAGQRGWGGMGMVGMGLVVVDVQRIFGYIAPHYTSPISSKTTLLNAPISPLAHLGLEIILVWPLVYYLLTTEGARTGRTFRSQATAITTFLLSPGIAALSTGPQRLANVELGMTLGTLVLLQRGRMLGALCLGGVGLGVLGVRGVWGAVVGVIVWTVCSRGTRDVGYIRLNVSDSPQWHRHLEVKLINRRAVSFIVGAAIVSVAHLSSRLIFAIWMGQNLIKVTSMHWYLVSQGSSTLLSGWTMTNGTSALGALIIAFAGCAVPSAVLSNACSSWSKQTKRAAGSRNTQDHVAAGSSFATIHEGDASPPNPATKMRHEKPDIIAPSLATVDSANANPTNDGRAPVLITVTSPNIADDANDSTVALAPLLPLFALAIYIPLSIAIYVSSPALQTNDFEHTALFAPTIPLALVGAYRGRSARSASDSTHTSRSSRLTGEHDKQQQGWNEEDEAWEMNSLVQLLTICAVYPSATAEQVWSGVSAAVWCVVMLGWRPWRVPHEGVSGRSILGAMRSSLAYAAPCAMLLCLLDTFPILLTLSLPRWLLPADVMQKIIPTSASPSQQRPHAHSGGNDWVSLQSIAEAVDFIPKLRAALPLAGILAWALVWVWAVNRLVKQSWAIGGLG